MWESSQGLPISRYLKYHRFDFLQVSFTNSIWHSGSFISSFIRLSHHIQGLQRIPAAPSEAGESRVGSPMQECHLVVRGRYFRLDSTSEIEAAKEPLCFSLQFPGTLCKKQNLSLSRYDFVRSHPVTVWLNEVQHLLFNVSSSMRWVWSNGENGEISTALFYLEIFPIW